jgi:cobalt/nickel transport system permease protein
MKNINSQSSGNHPLCNVDARVKLFVALSLLLMVVSSKGFIFPLLVGGTSLGICLYLKVRARLLLTRFAEPLFIAAVVLLLKALGTGDTPLWNINLPFVEITLYKEGLHEGFRLATRIVGGVAVVAAVGFATTFTELLAALSWFRIPREITEVAMFAWRYLFVLGDDAQVIHAAQKNRLGYVGVRRSFRSFGTLSGALVIKAFDASQTMTTSMVQRGYDGNMPMLRHRPLHWEELLPAVAIVAAMGALWTI